jgi:hypothetical protein
MWKVTEALAVGSALALAVRVTSGRLGTTLGATYRSPIILPQAEPEQAVPVTLHSTIFSSAPVTVAVTTCEPPAGICRLPGAEMLTAELTAQPLRSEDPAVIETVAALLHVAIKQYVQSTQRDTLAVNFATVELANGLHLADHVGTADFGRVEVLVPAKKIFNAGLYGAIAGSHEMDRRDAGPLI